jgi:glycine/D-amino acid oxidase-like deaminating enzyme/nitrite reductase/ring-hydroxylating ferredoxin subunit
METESHWRKSALLPRFPRLEDNLSVDVVVVGAGITGVTTACLLKQAGLSVALVERARCGGVDTAHTTAHLTAVIDTRLHELQKRFGNSGARAVWNAGTAAIERIASLVQEENIACEFQWCPGHLHAPTEDTDPEPFKREANAAAELEILAEYQDSLPLFNVPGVLFPRQAQFHPLSYLAGLLRVLPGTNAHVFEETEVHEIDKEARQIRTTKGRINFSHLVLATHNPLMGLAGLLRATLLQTKLSLYTSYALGARLPREGVPEGLFWDTAEPYHYLRIQKGRNHAYAIYGGEDHKTGQEADTPGAYARLEKKLRAFAPSVQIDSRWSGQVIETSDGLPFIGETAEHQFIATGFAGNGMTFGTVAGMMAVDSILGRTSPWKRLFDPHRKKLSATWDYLKENKDFPVCLVRDHLAKPQARSLRDVAPGEGKVVELNGKKVAAYRDAQGRVTTCSAICTHLQCVVGWNAAECTWDCPCHGSRFHPDGRVLSGPAEEPLPHVSPVTGRTPRTRREPARAAR